MLVRQAHEIEWVKKSHNSTSPIDYENKIKEICNDENISFFGFVGEWKGRNTKIKLKCAQSQRIWNISIVNLYKGKRCPCCANVRISKAKQLPLEETIDKVKQICNSKKNNINKN